MVSIGYLVFLFRCPAACPHQDVVPRLVRGIHLHNGPANKSRDDGWTDRPRDDALFDQNFTYQFF